MADTTNRGFVEIQVTNRTKAAYLATLDEAQSLPDAALLLMNKEVPSVLTTVFGVLPRAREMRPQFAALGGFDLERFDKLEQYAYSLAYSHAVYRTVVAPRAELTELGGKVVALRDRALWDAQGLANHGLLDGERLKECKTAQGYKPAAMDLLTVITLMNESWPTIANKTPWTPELLEDAEEQAIALMNAIGAKERDAITVNEAALARQRNYTLLVRAYDDLRHAVAFVRRDFDDADTIAPSLFAGRGGRPRKEDPTPAPSPAPLDTEHEAQRHAGSESEPKAGPEPKAKPSAKDPTAGFHMENGPNLPLTSPFQN